MKKSNRNRSLLVATIVLAGSLTGKPLVANDWIGPDMGDWFVPSNWSEGSLPDDTDAARIRNGGSVVFNTAGTTEIEKLRIGEGSNTGNGTLLMEAGTLQINLFDDDAIKLGPSSNQNGFIEQSGGIIQVLNGGVVIGQGSAAGGELGSYTISGGSLLVEGTNMSPFNTGQITVGESSGNGIFTVVGTGPTEISSNDRLEIEVNGTLRMILDASGVTPILSGLAGNLVDGPRFRSASANGPGSMLDIDFSALTTTIGDILLVNNRTADVLDGTLGSDQAFENAPEGTILHTFGDGTAYQVSYAFTAPDGMGEANDLALIAIDSSFLPGDFDNDEDVDGMDLTQWEGDFGINGDSDADNDGDSDGSDFLIWQRNYTGPAALAVGSAIPEPASGVLLVMGSIAGLVRLRRR